MFTRKMYEEMMIQHHGDWVDFFMRDIWENEGMSSSYTSAEDQLPLHKNTVLEVA